MKHLYTIIFCLLLTTVYFSCTHEAGAPENLDTEDSEIALDISRKRTRASEDENRSLDDTILSLRILVFDTIATSEKCLYNFKFGRLTGNKTVRFRVAPETTYNLVVITNEHKDPAVSAALEAFDENKKMEDVYGIYFSSSAFLDTEEIPMSATYNKLKVLSNRRWVNRQGGKTDTVTYPVPVEVVRLGVRLDITLKTKSADKKANLEHIRLKRIPAQVPLFPTNYEGNVIIDNTVDASNNDSYKTPEFLIDESSGTWETKHGDLDEDGEDEDYYVWTKARTIIPSTVFADPTSTTRGIDFILEYDDGYKEGVLLGINTPNTTCSKHYPSGTPPGSPYNYTLPRNTYLALDAIIEDDFIIFNSVTVAIWGDRNDVGIED